MEKDHIEDLTYMATVKNVKGTTTKQQLDVPRGHKAHIKIFQGYVAYRQDIKQPLQHDYTSITEDDINEYKVSQHYKCYIPGGTPPNLKHNYPPPVANPDITSFKKGIKRDPSQFKTLKRESDWDDWYAHIKVTAMAQGVEEVLNPTYLPVGNDDRELFNEKQKYLFQVLHSTVLTDKGKEIIKAYLPTLDAQIPKNLQLHRYHQAHYSSTSPQLKLTMANGKVLPLDSSSIGKKRSENTTQK